MPQRSVAPVPVPSIDFPLLPTIPKSTFLHVVIESLSALDGRVEPVDQEWRDRKPHEIAAAAILQNPKIQEDTENDVASFGYFAGRSHVASFGYLMRHHRRSHVASFGSVPCLINPQNSVGRFRKYHENQRITRSHVATFGYRTATR